jgi:glycosyltransferase involved in cell wall biosynthesis
VISVIIPTLNEENRISDIVQFCLSSSLVSEVIVIDDGSTDKTFELAKLAGAKVFFSSMLGKGTSMLDGLWKSKEDLVVYLDGDIFNFSQSLLEEMVRPLMENRCDFVKGRFHRVAGRVTAITARPLLKVFFPEISHIDQPLGGIIAAKKELLKNIKSTC